MHVSRSGLIACAHFSSLYPMPLRLGVEESEAVLSVVEMSLELIGAQVLVGCAGGLSS
jgi:hypothetical protein